MLNRLLVLFNTAPGDSFAFVTNRTGDAGFILALFMSWHRLGGLE